MSERTNAELADALNGMHHGVMQKELLDEIEVRLREMDGERIDGRVFRGDKCWYFEYSTPKSCNPLISLSFSRSAVIFAIFRRVLPVPLPSNHPVGSVPLHPLSSYIYIILVSKTHYYTQVQVD